MQLFISYARVDKAVADDLVTDLRALGHSAFYDHDLTGGQRWWDALLDQIEAAEVFVPVLSDDFRGSEPCRAEVAFARACGIPFLPVATTPQTPGLYDPVIAEANWVAYDPETRGSLAVLARSLGSMAPVDPPAVRPERPAVPVTYLTSLEQQIRGAGPISRGDQLALVSDLGARFGTRDEAVASALLGSLRARPELTVEAAAAIDGLLGRKARGRHRSRTTGGVLVSLATLAWLVALVALPWAPYQLFDDSPVERPLLWEGDNIVPRPYAALAAAVALLVTGLTVLVMFVKVPVRLRAALAGAGSVVAVVAVVGTTTASLAVSAGSGPWVYLAAMLTLGAAAVLSG